MSGPVHPPQALNKPVAALLARAFEAGKLAR